MITLPTLPTSVTSENGIDTSATGANLLADDSKPQAFLTLLGNRLLTLAQKSGENTADTTQLASGETSEEQPVSELSALLAALDKPETLNTLLQAENVKGDSKTADDKDKLKTTELSDSDMQALQALFAMLPQNPALAQVTTANQSDMLTATTRDGSDKTNALAAMLSNITGQTTADATSESVPTGVSSAAMTQVADGKSTTALMPSAIDVNSNGSSQTRSDDGSVSSATSAFQQVLNSISKEELQDQNLNQSSSTPNLSAVVSSASTAATAPIASATTMTPATPQLNSQLGSPEWQQALGQQVLMFSRNGQQNAELRLHPQDLGSIQISLKLDNDQAQLSMVSGHSQVRAALEAAIPQLRTALAESGINLGQTSVSSDAFPQSQSFNGQQESRRDSSGNSSFAQALEGDSEITPIAVPAALQARATGNNSVDIFA
ncbi:flagellar hook-length control protein FliK [Pantoea sp. B65]|uniref:flagellar hook-length control protein FliK n=1 Tax=Pantoea sp. B65 TaxID=2813359 RepID=UPI0039B6E953